MQSIENNQNYTQINQLRNDFIKISDRQSQMVDEIRREPTIHETYFPGQ